MAVGTYATQAEMVARYGTEELVQATNLEIDNTGAIVTAVLDAALDEANSLADSYVQAKYTLPLGSVSPALIGQACALARYLLWKNRASDRVFAGYESAISWLKDVAKGVVSLGPTATEDAPTAAVGPTYSESDVDPTNTLSNLYDYTNPS